MIKTLADAKLAELSPVFDEMYAEGGRPSIPPERLLKSMLLIALYTVRSERLFCEQALEGFDALKWVFGQIFEERPALGQRRANMTKGKLHRKVRLRREVIVDRRGRDGSGFRDLRDERRFVSASRE